jgi:hypothetical protein
MSISKNASEWVESELPKVLPIQPIRNVTRKFVGDQSLREILVSVFENQVDNMVESIYHTTRANTVTSQTTQTEGDELL